MNNPDCKYNGICNIDCKTYGPYGKEPANQPLHSLAERYLIYQKAIKLWGIQSQQDLLLEEMAELTQAILKARRHGVQFSYLVFEEMADVEIMLEQMEFTLKNMPQMLADDPNKNLYHLVQDCKTKKLNRLRKRVEKNGT